MRVQWMRDQASRQTEGWDYLKLISYTQVHKSVNDMQTSPAWKHFTLEWNISKKLLTMLSSWHAVLRCSQFGYADAFRTGADIGFNFDID